MTNPLLFPEYRNLSNDDLNVSRPVLPLPVTIETNTLMSEIFVPDPVTNLPLSDTHLVYSKDADPVVAQFVRDNLLSPNPDNHNFGDDSEAALDMVRDRRESIVNYAERLRQTIADYEAREHKE